MIREGWRADPVTSIVTALVGAWMLAFGTVLLTFPITPARRHSFQGAAELFGIRGWGILFIVGAACQLVRLLILQRHRLALLLNFIPTAICAAWAAGWLTGPLSTAQPTYLFIAAVVLLHPHLRHFVERYYTVTRRG